jgi:uncharacterized protein (TIGR04255 family)
MLMAEEIISDNTLTKNDIKDFILRVDLINNGQFEIARIAEKMSEHFDRTEKKQINNFSINFTKGSSEVTKGDTFDYVLVSEEKSLSMTFSETQCAFWLESNQYKDNSLYKGIINKLVNVVESFDSEIKSKRIGLRYVNQFQCKTKNIIGKIYGKRLSSLVRAMLSEEDMQSRVIGMEEHNNDGFKMRFQYGIPNKFYPAVIAVFDLLLDIDSFVESENCATEWEDLIRSLNHAAYSKFVKEINPKYLEGLK